MKSDTFANRLSKAMKLRNMKQSILSEKTQIDKTLINKYIKGIAECGNDKLSCIAKVLDVNEVWLMGYDVPMDSNLVFVVDKDIGNFKKGQILKEENEIEKYSNLLEKEIKKYKMMFDEVREYIDKNLPKIKKQLNQKLIKNKITIEQYNDEIRKFLWILKIIDEMTLEEFNILVKKHLK